MSAVGGNAAPDLERVRFVTENYKNLQGLKMLPTGLMLLVLAAFYWLHSLWFAFLGVALMLGALWVQPVIGRYYERKFGHVEPRPPMIQRTTAMVLITIFVVFVVLAMLNNTGYVDVSGYINTYIVFPAKQQLPVNILLLATAVMYLISCILGWQKLRFRLHYLVLSVLGVGASFLPLFGVLTEPIEVFFGFCGLIITVGGVFDHLLLVRTMRPLPEEDDGGAV